MFGKKDKVQDYTKAPFRVNWVNLSKEIFEWVICIVIAYVIYLVLNFFIGTVSGVKQVSMYPTAREGDRLFIIRPVIFKKELKYGDIITFKAPQSNGYYGIEGEGEKEVTSSEDNVIAEYKKYNVFTGFLYNFVGIGKISYIKRVIGVAGDHIYIDDEGWVFVNDERIVEPYLHDPFTTKSGRFTDLVVPEGCVYVMGDNRADSKDSRYFGCIPLNEIDGYVVGRIWPFSRFGKLDK